MKTYSFRLLYFDQTSVFIVKSDNSLLAFRKLKHSVYKDADVYGGITVENTDFSDWLITDITDEDCIAVA